MGLNLIGLGVSTKGSLTLAGLEAVRRSEVVYLEGYTSFLISKKEEIEKEIGKEIIVLDREKVESDFLIKDASEKEVSLLVAGDPLMATTHYELYRVAKKVGVKVYHNTSIFNLVTRTGLQAYKFGKTTSIAFFNSEYRPKSSIEVFHENKEIGAHTLFLLDIDPMKNNALSIVDAVEYLIALDTLLKKENFLACARLGSEDEIIAYSSVDKLKEIDFGKPPYCLILPGKLHFLEEEALEEWKK